MERPLDVVHTRDNDPHPQTAAMEACLSDAFRVIKRAYPEAEILFFIVSNGQGILFTDMPAKVVLAAAGHMIERTNAIELEEKDGNRTED